MLDIVAIIGNTKHIVPNVQQPILNLQSRLSAEGGKTPNKANNLRFAFKNFILQTDSKHLGQTLNYHLLRFGNGFPLLYQAILRGKPTERNGFIILIKKVMTSLRQLLI